MAEDLPLELARFIIEDDELAPATAGPSIEGAAITASTVIAVGLAEIQMRAFFAFLAATVTEGVQTAAAIVAIGSPRTYVFVAHGSKPIAASAAEFILIAN